MNEKRPQHLAEAFSGIISMMLMAIRAHGWRCLLHLPEIWRTEREFRRMGEEFAALVADFIAGTLPPLPAPLAAVPEQEAEYEWPPAAPRPARPNPAPRDRRARAMRRPRPATDAGPGHLRAEPAAVLMDSWPNPGMRAIPSRRAPGPTAFPGLPTVATGRSP